MQSVSSSSVSVAAKCTIPAEAPAFSFPAALLQWLLPPQVKAFGIEFSVEIPGLGVEFLQVSLVCLLR